MQSLKKLIIYGKENVEKGVVKYTIEANNRDNSIKHDIALEKDCLLEFEFEDNTTWMCDPSSLHDLYPQVDEAIKTPSDRSKSSDSFELPATLDGPLEDRGIMGKIALKALSVITKKPIAAKIGQLAENFENKNLRNLKANDSGMWIADTQEKYLRRGCQVFRISKDFKFKEFDGVHNNKACFLFIHGTNSDTLGAFEKLAESDAWNSIHEIYGDNVLAFQHRTLTQSPLENAVKLSQLLPNDIELHMISHSRGGIIGDILCKYSSHGNESGIGFSNSHLNLLKKEGKREKDIENIRKLNKIYKTKRIRISKFIRVACPAAGTILASSRLDYFLNVFFNILGFAGPVGEIADIFKELLSSAIRNKENTEVLPGIEAQRPSSPFMKILNDQNDENAIDGSSLAVISGNGAINFSGKGLLVILGKLFYWQRNDLVVNTDSMYLGAKRRKNIQYFFDQNAEVDHVKYFVNNSTREAINLAVKADAGAGIPGFRSIGQNNIPGSDRGERGLEYGKLYPLPNMPSGKRPIVVLLPGIMGSSLSRKDDDLWLNYFNILRGGLIELEYTNDNSIDADSVVKTSYKKLSKWLSGKYDVIIYPFDWRKQLNVCAQEFNGKIKSLLQHGQPIKIIGHSMGGVLARDFIINHPKTWEKLNNSKGFRMVFLGSPLGGSHRILTVLFGQDAIINKLSMVDLQHTKRELLEMFCRFPGILSLLPLTKDKENDFSDIGVWNEMRKVFNKPDWPIPSQEDLDVFRVYRDNILRKKNQIDYSNMAYIAGKDKITPYGYYKDEILPKRELVFLYTSAGDQSVTWELGIPKELVDREAVYYTRTTHGSLANDPDIFEGIEDILSNGSTKLLRNKELLIRGEEKIFRAQPAFNFDPSEESFENTILGIADKKEPTGSQVPITVTVSNGDLCYASYPVLAGHFLNDGILYAERSINDYLNGGLSLKHRLGLYPGEIGTYAVFGRNNENDFNGAIIVGLGEAGSLTSFELAKTVEQGIANYLLSIKYQKSDGKKTGISVLTIGSGYGGLSIENSLKAIIEGVVSANNKVKDLGEDDLKAIQHIEFVELYSNKALSCMYALNRIANEEITSYNIIIGNKRIKNLLGIRKRIPLDNTEDWWNRITVKYKPASKNGEEVSSMVFGASTGEARVEENKQYSSTQLVDLFISEISTEHRWSPETAKTLFELLIPNPLKEKLKKKGNLSWILDVKTAEYPWELLQDNTINTKPLCVNAGMIRQLSTEDYRINIKRVAENKALIIADPILNGFICQLPGAKEEGKEVEATLLNAGYPTTTIINKDAANIVRSFFSHDYAIIHLAGHGVFNPDSPKKSGMVIGKDIFLTVFEIQQMPVVPELVFVNCCHLGSTKSEDEKYYQDRYKLAANIGTQLIRIGVKAVIAAGWAVGDAPALDFAKLFYRNLFGGDNFGDAIQKARSYIFKKYPESNTWGAYQCYGDPFFKLKNNSGIKQPWSPSYIVPEEAEIHLDNLLNELQLGDKSTEDYLKDLETITESVQRDVFETAHIIEKQAMIYLELGMYGEAIKKFESLFKKEKASFSFSCMEKYYNASAKHIIQNIFNADIETKKSVEARGEAYIELKNVIMELELLKRAGETAERLNLLGSSYKRLAQLAVNREDLKAAYEGAYAYYEQAFNKPNNKNKIYPLTNAIEIGCLMVYSGLFDPGDKYAFNGNSYTIRKEEDAKREIKMFKDHIPKLDEKDTLDYWDMVATFNIDLCLLLAGDKDMDGDNLTRDLKRLWNKAGSEGKRISELEHLQFLVHSLSLAARLKNKRENAFRDIDVLKKTDEIESQIIKVMNALNDLMSIKTAENVKNLPDPSSNGEPKIQRKRRTKPLRPKE